MVDVASAVEEARIDIRLISACTLRPSAFNDASANKSADTLRFAALRISRKPEKEARALFYPFARRRDLIDTSRCIIDVKAAARYGFLPTTTWLDRAQRRNPQ